MYICLFIGRISNGISDNVVITYFLCNLLGSNEVLKHRSINTTQLNFDSKMSRAPQDQAKSEWEREYQAQVREWKGTLRAGEKHASSEKRPWLPPP